MKQFEDGNLVETMDDVALVLRRLKDPETKRVVYDSETTGLEPRTDKIVGHVITFGPRPQDNYYVPVAHGDPPSGNIANPVKFHKALHKIASTRRDLHWIGHNFMFDLRFLWMTGIEIIGTMEDTQVNEPLLDEFIRKYSLGESCIRHGVKEKKGDELYRYLASRFGGEPTRDQMANFWRLEGNNPLGVDYALGDGISTWELREAQIKDLEGQSLGRVHHTEQRITRVLYRMMKRGVRVDWNELDRVEEEVEGMLAKAEEKLPEGFNPKAPSQVKALMEKHGHTNWPLTEKGRPQFNEAWLKTNDIGKDILTVRRFKTLKTSFINPLRNDHRWFDDRIRCNYYQMASDDFGTVTGRFSCAAPNLQQVPKRNKELGLIFRRVFVPNPGSRWLSADMSQCEPRLLAHYSEAAVLMRGYLASPFVDCHASVTREANFEEMLGVPFKEAREYGKRLNQSLITGAGKGKVIEMLGSSRGASLYDKYFEIMPEIKELQKSSSRKMERQGYVTSFFGRRARMESRSKSYLAINRLLQVGNADLMKESMADMDEYFESEGDIVSILNTVHDAIDLDVPEGAEEIADHGLGFMCQYGPGRRYQLDVPMAIEYRYGANWSEATYVGDEHIMGAEASDPRFLIAEAAAQ